MKFEIKHRFTGSVLFELKTESLKLCVEAAVRSCADLGGANLGGADLGGAYLGGAYLGGADLRRAELGGAYLRGANLGGADLGGAYLRGANLGGADLGGAYLGGAYLGGADLGGADLRGADLCGADLGGANLCGAYLGGAEGFNRFATDDLTMLRDQPGAIRAYKLVTDKGVGPYNGGIKYEVGKSYEVNDASTDESEQCAAGINLATLPWCLREWRYGYRILIAEFAAADIAAIPHGTHGKFRVHRCRIVGEKSLAELNWPPKREEAKEAA